MIHITSERVWPPRSRVVHVVSFDPVPEHSLCQGSWPYLVTWYNLRRFDPRRLYVALVEHKPPRLMTSALDPTPAPKADINEQYGNRGTQVDGAPGGAGGPGYTYGGHGANGRAPGGIDFEHVHLFSRIGAGPGGNGGEGKNGHGGRPGRADAAQFGERPFLVEWELGLVDDKPIPLPIMKTADFCEHYLLGIKFSSVSRENT
ncbi:hypothetical protein B0H14DRAFT_687677 [Mycena olivaceomarginata]|nr:hypothetical protein B0H14DRAFT_687677 [Mycena olivaceomarginata]